MRRRRPKLVCSVRVCVCVNNILLLRCVSVSISSIYIHVRTRNIMSVLYI